MCLSKKRIEKFFVSDGRSRTMSGEDFGIWRKNKQLVFYRVNQLRVASSRKIRAANRTGKKGIPRKQNIRTAFEADASFSMTRSVNNIDFYVPYLNYVSFLQRRSASLKFNPRPAKVERFFLESVSIPASSAWINTFAPVACCTSAKAPMWST